MAEDCLFCRIASGAIPSKKAYEDERFFAFHDIDPQAPVHVLVIPKEHVRDLDAVPPGRAGLVGDLLTLLPRLARDLGIAGAYRVVNNCGPTAGQSIFHIHFHLLGGRAMRWPPG